MTQQFSAISDALKWCIDHPNQRLRDRNGREIWADRRFEGLYLIQTNIDLFGVAREKLGDDLLLEHLQYFDLSTLRPAEADPEKPTLENLAALENWDKMLIHYPDGPRDHYKEQNGTWAYHYPQLKVALETGWPVEFERDEK
jgi:hypothetical protein